MKKNAILVPLDSVVVFERGRRAGRYACAFARPAFACESFSTRISAKITASALGGTLRIGLVVDSF